MFEAHLDKPNGEYFPHVRPNFWLHSDEVVLRNGEFVFKEEHRFDGPRWNDGRVFWSKPRTRHCPNHFERFCAEQFDGDFVPPMINHLQQFSVYGNNKSSSDQINVRNVLPQHFQLSSSFPPNLVDVAQKKSRNYIKFEQIVVNRWKSLFSIETQLTLVDFDFRWFAETRVRIDDDAADVLNHSWYQSLWLIATDTILVKNRVKVILILVDLLEPREHDVERTNVKHEITFVCYLLWPLLRVDDVARRCSSS